MAHRFCTRCNAEVEDAGGYCLLGHDLRLEAPVDSLRALRAEVNRTFDEARRELADVMAPAAAVAPTPQSPPGRRIRLDEARVLEGDSLDEREWADAPVSVADAGPAAATPEPHRPAPPPSPVANVWDGLDEAPTLSPGDPIASFAPSPRMDWGPRKAGLLGRRARDEQHTGA